MTCLSSQPIVVDGDGKAKRKNRETGCGKKQFHFNFIFGENQEIRNCKKYKAGTQQNAGE